MAEQTASVLCKVGDHKAKGVKGNVKDGTVVQTIQKVNGVRTVIGTATVLIGTVTPVDKAPIVSAGDDQQVSSGQKGIVLDGEAHDEGRIVRAEWKQTQGMVVELIKDPADITKVSFDAPVLQAEQKSIVMLFEFEAEDDAANITKDACIITVGEKILPPPPPEADKVFPIPDISWLYSSKEVLSHDGTFPSKKRSPFDPVLLFSNASGVQNHTVNSDWLTINTGQQFGRTYWELYEIPQFNASKLGQTTIMAGVFSMSAVGQSNFSIKLGDHGTTGYSFDGKKFFGGFGQSFHEDQWESKCEWKHGTPEGSEKQVKYPNGQKIKAKTPYPFFSAYVGSEEKNTMTLNTWIKFPGSDEWVHVGEHVWEKDSEWENNSQSIAKDALDYDETQKGPGFIKSDHVWTRANQGNVDVQKIMFGTLA